MQIFIHSSVSRFCVTLVWLALLFMCSELWDSFALDKQLKLIYLIRRENTSGAFTEWNVIVIYKSKDIGKGSSIFT